MIFTNEILQTLFGNSQSYQPSYTHFLIDLGQLLSIACNIDGYSFVAKLFSSLCTACNSIAGEKPGNKAKVAKENTFVSPL